MCTVPLDPDQLQYPLNIMQQLSPNFIFYLFILFYFFTLLQVKVVFD